MPNKLLLRRGLLGLALLLSAGGLAYTVLKEPTWTKDEAIFLGEYSRVLGAADACRIPVASRAEDLRRWVTGHFRPFPEYFRTFSEQQRTLGRLQQDTGGAACEKTLARYKALDWSRTRLTLGERLFPGE